MGITKYSGRRLIIRWSQVRILLGPVQKSPLFYIEDSRLVREVANLAPNFGDYHKPIENRIEQLRGFGKTFVPLRDACEKEPDLVLAPVGAPSLTVVGKAGDSVRSIGRKGQPAST